MSRRVLVPSTLALLPQYASVEDPLPDLRAAVHGAVGWLLEGGPAEVVATTDSARRVGAALLTSPSGPANGSARHAGDPGAAGSGTLVVANGTATRSEKAPGHLDDRAAAFDRAIGDALAAADTARLRDLDVALAEELWCRDVPALQSLADGPGKVQQVQVDYDAAPYGVQYWVVRLLFT